MARRMRVKFVSVAVTLSSGNRDRNDSTRVSISSNVWFCCWTARRAKKSSFIVSLLSWMEPTHHHTPLTGKSEQRDATVFIYFCGAAGYNGDVTANGVPMKKEEE